jgi:hypothetical protein
MIRQHPTQLTQLSLLTAAARNLPSTLDPRSVKPSQTKSNQIKPNQTKSDQRVFLETVPSNCATTAETVP